MRKLKLWSGILTVLAILQPTMARADYYGGPIMLGTPHIYYIWYGYWESSTASILTYFAQNLGGSDYYNIMTTYYDANGNHLSNSLQYGGGTWDPYSRGLHLMRSDVQQIVASALASRSLPIDPNGIYLVLADLDVTHGPLDIVDPAYPDYPFGWCGYHSHFDQGGVTIKYGYVPDPYRYAPYCMDQLTSSPNDNPRADSIANTIASVLFKIVSDPFGNAWHGVWSREYADFCAAAYAPYYYYYVSNGSRATAKIGARDYYLQPNWVVAPAYGGHCDITYPWTLVFYGWDNRRTTRTGDWSVNNLKAECGETEALIGLSQSSYTSWTHAALCRNDNHRFYPHNSCHTLDFSNGDNRMTQITGDWDIGAYKGECAVNEYVAGVSQTQDGHIKAILCCAGNVQHRNCRGNNFFWSDARENGNWTPDWDVGWLKGECGEHRYVAGVSRNIAWGAPNSILCCSDF